MKNIELALVVNGRKEELSIPPNRTLLEMLREDLQLTGAKEGCGHGECGACMVILDGRTVNSCARGAGRAASASSGEASSMVVTQRRPSAALPTTTAGISSEHGVPGSKGTTPKASGDTPPTSSWWSIAASAAGTSASGTRAATPRAPKPTPSRTNRYPSPPATSLRLRSRSSGRV